ncbi:related to DNA replication regulator SLD2 [Rhynchosporium agropyri]|uniref:DNA replication regulator SLD2 n=1 Tax=Rhynchosporium agropyri TaxID=914238 RepID=A0A1E1KIW6_9HELO|nr:related to DNA replication regulator SLD2 [Rhynchosporium agropyri]
MEDSKREELTETSNSLRVELKSWEKAFSAANEGKKASREDIKKDVEIAAKYKEYNKIRDVLSGKIALPALAAPRQTPRKRKHEDYTGQEISKRQLISRTPSKGILQPWEVDPYDSPSVIRNLFTPSKKALGPTPQKDGMVLGLFDLLHENATADTPSRRNAQSVGLKAIHATPRKIGSDNPLKGSRTPGSGKRLLDAFVTPAKNRHINGQAGTPSSVSKLHFNTPSFLRRNNHRVQLPAVNEEEGLELSPQMVRVPRKPIVRGLSSMLAGLRKMEDEAADDDLDVLREMEMEMSMEGGRTTSPKPKPKPLAKSIPVATKENILVADSQTNLVGGFDDEAQFDSDIEDQKDRDGQPLKVYKKKGQKRTTRRTKMKPTRSKPSNPQPSALVEDSDDELAGTGELVPETQVDDDTDEKLDAGVDGDGTAPFEEGRNYDSGSQSEYTASEGGTRYRRPDQSKKRKVMTKDGKIRTVARKVGAMAHTNFKRLKLRNTGSKGGPAHNSRFRRKK